jgi:hypothetical protein
MLAAILERLLMTSDLWNHYAAAVVKMKLPYATVPIDRSRRSIGEFKMGFLDDVEFLPKYSTPESSLRRTSPDLGTAKLNAVSNSRFGFEQLTTNVGTDDIALR